MKNDEIKQFRNQESVLKGYGTMVKFLKFCMQFKLKNLKALTTQLEKTFYGEFQEFSEIEQE